MRGILCFLSGESVALHEEYLAQLCLRRSALEKSEPRLSGASLADLARLPIGKDMRAEAAGLLGEIEAHELYFASFDEKHAFCPALRKYYGSENGFLYAVLTAAKEAAKRGSAFLAVGLDRAGKIAFADGTGASAMLAVRPVFALDLCEHAYFTDYRFDKDKYLFRAVSYLNLRKCADF